MERKNDQVTEHNFINQELENTGNIETFCTCQSFIVHSTERDCQQNNEISPSICYSK